MSTRKHNVNHDFFETIRTPQQAYWLGFLSADGCVTGGRVAVNLKRTEEGQLVRFRDAIGSTYPIYHSSYFDKRTKKTYYSSRVQFVSQKMCADLKGHGLHPGTKSFDLQPWNGPRNLQKYYWLGLWDGDGTMRCDGKRVSIGVCGTRHVIDGFAAFAESLHGELQPLTRFGNNVWYLSYERLRDSKLVAATLYGGNVAEMLAMPRKLTIAQAIVARPIQRLRHQFEGHTLASIDALKTKHGEWSEVAKILQCHPKSICQFRGRFKKETTLAV
jgi:hypothetical protein